MNIEDFRDYCLLKAGVTEETPFGPETLVFKVGGKVFALTDIDTFGSINLKCDPERAQELREQHDYVLPGYHMNKQHWISLAAGPGITPDLVEELVLNAYELVVEGLPRAKRPVLRHTRTGAQP